MAAATDPGPFGEEAPAPNPSLVKPGSKKPLPKPRGPRQGITHEDSHHFGGIKSVGALYTSEKAKTHHCTAFVVDSPGRDLILTAGHCKGGNGMFIPKYDKTKPLKQQPYGFWIVNKWYWDGNFQADTSRDVSDLDFAFGRVDKYDGKNIQDVVGGNTLQRTSGAKHHVTVIGYPMTKYDPADTAIKCNTQTGALPGFNQMRIDCAGLWGGVSGSPWFASVDYDRGVGTVIGNVGGANNGGPNVGADNPLYNRLTYSPMYMDRLFLLYEDAKKNSDAGHGSYRQPTPPYSVGTAATWKHAKLMAAGDFNGTGMSDLVVVWTDGEVTLYNSDRNGDFASERQLTSKNGTWADAQAVTAGDFGGDSQFDLLAVWPNGQVELFTDIGRNGLGNSKEMAPKGSIWSHAMSIAAGRFNADKYVTDLMVRWSDGELTLYTNVSPGTFGQEHQLKDPKKTDTWKHAKLLTAGEFSGNSKWDLLVSWTDGEVDSYVGTTTSALGGEHRLLDPNGTWEHNMAMTTGRFVSGDRTNDLLIRWSDGETTIYNNTQPGRLGTENTLVYPVM
ncbi:FG-GAP-like repeat-containing protein [Streptomyces sp. CA-181903]|uniref:FG-GAP-like repeat-containing protein n=1 Tax=Streptomyces sp. CA-181903 TaxID=3240055 RepID=UPI003D90FFB5